LVEAYTNTHKHAQAHILTENELLNKLECDVEKDPPFSKDVNEDPNGVDAAADEAPFIKDVNEDPNGMDSVFSMSGEKSKAGSGFVLRDADSNCATSFRLCGESSVASSRCRLAALSPGTQLSRLNLTTT